MSISEIVAPEGFGAKPYGTTDRPMDGFDSMAEMTCWPPEPAPKTMTRS